MGGIAQLEDYDEQLYCVTGKTDDPAGASEKYLLRRRSSHLRLPHGRVA